MTPQNSDLLNPATAGRSHAALQYLPIIALLGFFAFIFWLTLFPGVGGRINFGDSAKWQLLWMVDGTPHSPGYPLFLIITKAAGNSLLFLEPWLRITLLSVLFALAALAQLFALMKLITHSRTLALLAVFIFGTSLTFWSQATEAEVYTLNLFFVLSTVYCFLKFHLSRRMRYFYLGCAVYALSFGNHLTMITLLPAIIYLVYVTDRSLFLNIRCVALVAAMVLAGASQYYYLWHLSHNAPEQLETYTDFSKPAEAQVWLPQGGHLEFLGRETDIATFFDYILGGQFKGQMGQNHYLENTQYFINLLLTEELGAMVCLLLLILLFAAAGRRQLASTTQPRIFTIFLGLILVSQYLFGFSYAIFDLRVYFIPMIALLLALIFMLTAPLARYHWVVGLLAILSLGKAADNFNVLQTPYNARHQEVMQTIKSAPTEYPIFFFRHGILDYSGFMQLHYHRFCQGCEVQRHITNDLSTVTEAPLVYGLFARNLNALERATLEQHFQLNKLRLSPDLLDLQRQLAKDELLLIAANRFAGTGDEMGLISALTQLGSELAATLPELQESNYLAAIDASGIRFEAAGREPLRSSGAEMKAIIGADYFRDVNLRANSYGEHKKDLKHAMLNRDFIIPKLTGNIFLQQPDMPVIRIKGRNFAPLRHGINIVRYHPPSGVVTSVHGFNEGQYTYPRLQLYEMSARTDSDN